MAAAAGDNTAAAMKSVVVDPPHYDWEGDTPIVRPFLDTVIYELHVRGFTRHPNGVDRRTNAERTPASIEKIPYLNPRRHGRRADAGARVPRSGTAPTGSPNYWGYDPMAFFAPHRGYSSRHDARRRVHEFRDMVKALHAAGIEVILDVVFNHTAEGNETGPTLSFKGSRTRPITCSTDDGSATSNYTGCGNTVNGNHPVVREMIFHCLRHWVQQMHVDGFRFDLASILSRDAHGEPSPNPPSAGMIADDPLLADTKIIAEAVGRRRAVSSRQLRRRCAGRSGTAAIATTCARFWRGDAGRPSARWPTASSAPAISISTSGRQPITASTSSRRTMASRSTIW